MRKTDASAPDDGSDEFMTIVTSIRFPALSLFLNEKLSFESEPFSFMKTERAFKRSKEEASIRLEKLRRAAGKAGVKFANLETSLENS